MSEIHSEKCLSRRSRRKKTAGFTLVEILIALGIVATLSAIAYPLYQNYIDKAKLTVGISTLETVRKTIEDYHITYGYYPPALDIATGQDSAGKIVLDAMLLTEFKKNLSSLESFTPATDDYTLTAKAIDAKQTLLVLKPSSVISQGP